MRVFPGATLRILKRPGVIGPKRAKTVGIILHCAAGNSRSLVPVFDYPGNPVASSNFYGLKDGSVEQYMDADRTAWATRGKSRETLSVETQNTGDEPWTARQCEALARLIAWGHQEYGYPLTLMRGAFPGEQGIGWHSMGCPVWPARKMPLGKETWGPVGKTCPGPKCIAQIPGILARAREIVGEQRKESVAKPAGNGPLSAVPITRTLGRGARGRDVQRLQERLRQLAPWWRLGTKNLSVDGIYGIDTASAVSAAQKRQQIAVDGIAGPQTLKALGLDRTY